MHRHLGTMLLANAVLLATARHAPAAKPVTPARTVHVDYESADGCPDESVFLERLAARTSNVKTSPEGGGTPKVIIRVTRGGAGKRVHGELLVRETDGTEARRTVDGETCDSVVDAVALMSAMALDPTLVMGGKSPPEEPPEPTKDGAEGRPPLDGEPGTHLALGAGGGVAFGAAPLVAPSVDAFLELAWKTGSLVSPSVRAGFEYATSRDGAVTGAAGGLELTRSLATVDGCPIAWSQGSFRLMPCLHFEAGVVSAAGLDVTPARSAVRPWAAAGALGHARYVFARRAFVELTGGVSLPFVRDQFYVEPNTTVFKAPVVSGLAGAAVGFTIL